MSSHRAPKPRRADRRSPRRRSGRTRALISLGAVAVLATGMSVKGTFAFWTDAATAQTGSFTAGNLDITLDGQLVGVAGANNGANNGTYTNNNFALPTMVPGESYAYTFPVKNQGTVPLTYTLTGTGSGGLAAATGMQYSVTFSNNPITVSNTGTAAETNRVGKCAGVTPTDTNTTALVAGAAPTTFGTANRSLLVNATEYVCIVARFNSNAPNSYQNLTGSAAFLFDSKQVGPA